MVEIRNTEYFTAGWKVFSLENNHCIFSLENLKNSWWYSLVYANFPFFILQEIKQGKNPEIKETLLINIIENKLEYFPNYRFKGLESNRVELINNQNEILELDLKVDFKPFMKNPVVYSEKNDYFEDFSAFIEMVSRKQAVLECEYLEINKYLVIGFYDRQSEENYTSNIILLDNFGELVFQNESYTKLKGIIHGIFFAVNNKIIYTNEKNEIHICTL